jgi:Putative transposase
MADISPLRRRMIEDMTVRNLSPATQQSYLSAISKFSRYFGRSAGKQPSLRPSEPPIGAQNPQKLRRQHDVAVLAALALLDPDHHALPASVGEIAFQNKATVYAILFRTAAETLATIAADPRHLGAKLGMTMVLHTWGQTLQHHPHVHCVVPGSGPSLDGTRWVACRRGFFLPVRVLSRLFRRLFLRELENAFNAGKLRFFNSLADLAAPQAFERRLAELRRLDWVVYAKPPFGGSAQVLAYLGHYTHRVAIANSRLISLADGKVRFTWKDYRADAKTKVITLAADEFIRRFLLHALPDAFHRNRHYGFLANGGRSDHLARCRQLLDAHDTGAREPTNNRAKDDRPLTTADFAICPDCGGTMQRIAIVPRACNPQPFSCDTS